jgi:hypothetical protein
MVLIYVYSYTSDENDISKFFNHFTEDGIWVSPIGTALSREEIYNLLAHGEKGLLKEVSKTGTSKPT